MSFLLVTMGKKWCKAKGKPFEANDSRINRDGQPPPPPSATSTTPTRIREPKTVFDQISSSKFHGGIPVGAQLRPRPDSDKIVTGRDETDTTNWVVDEQKLLDATNDALKCHDKSPKRNHTPILKKEKTVNVGFGVSLSFSCNYKNCQFTSQLYKLYDETPSGQPVANAQVGVAMAKSELTPKTVNLLGTALNLVSPSQKTLQKSYSQTLLSSNELAESAMTENRGFVTSAVRLLGQHNEGEIPTIDVSTDGQYSNRSYHFPTGKSDSVSVPVIENVTGMGLLINHENLSHRDGTLPRDVHINAAETLAAQKNVVNSYEAKEYPLYYGTVTTDGDASVVKALETARNSIGESRPLKRRGCIFHGEQAGIR